jgi:amino acid permease
LDRPAARGFGGYSVFWCEGLWRGKFTESLLENELIEEQVEFVLSVIKILACIGFIILGIIIDCGGVPTDHRGYIGARYWYFHTRNGYGRG